MKIFIIAALIFGSVVGFLFGTFVLLFVGIRFGQFMDRIEEMYGFRGSIIAFLIALAVASIIVATVLVVSGV
jgi:hypothetical protein